MEVLLREVLGITKKEFHESIVDLVKRKRLSMEPELENPVEVQTTHLEDMALEDELAESHYSRLHWARATMETPARIRDVQEPVVVLVNHDSEINLMSMDFYRKGVEIQAQHRPDRLKKPRTESVGTDRLGRVPSRLGPIG